MQRKNQNGLWTSSTPTETKIVVDSRLDYREGTHTICILNNKQIFFTPEYTDCPHLPFHPRTENRQPRKFKTNVSRATQEESIPCLVVARQDKASTPQRNLRRESSTEKRAIKPENRDLGCRPTAEPTNASRQETTTPYFGMTYSAHARGHRLDMRYSVLFVYERRS